jgi:hypothetical protein
MCQLHKSHDGTDWSHKFADCGHVDNVKTKDVETLCMSYVPRKFRENRKIVSKFIVGQPSKLTLRIELQVCWSVYKQG